MKNSVSLIGNVGGDPETRVTTSGTRITSFSLATSQRWKDKNTGERKEKTEWHRIVCFNGVGKSVEAIVIKGQKVAVDGSLRRRGRHQRNLFDKETAMARKIEFALWIITLIGMPLLTAMHLRGVI